MIEKGKMALEIPGDKLDASIERELIVPPVELSNFLDELSIDYGLPLSSDDRRRIDSVQDIVRLITERRLETVQ